MWCGVQKQKISLEKSTEYIKADGNTDLNFARTDRAIGIDLGAVDPIGRVEAVCMKYVEERRVTADGTNKHLRNQSYYNNVYNYNNNNFKISTRLTTLHSFLLYLSKATFDRYYHSDSIEEKAENYTIAFYSH